MSNGGWILSFQSIRFRLPGCGKLFFSAASLLGGMLYFQDDQVQQSLISDSRPCNSSRSLPLSSTSLQVSSGMICDLSNPLDFFSIPLRKFSSQDQNQFNVSNRFQVKTKISSDLKIDVDSLISQLDNKENMEAIKTLIGFVSESLVSAELVASKKIVKVINGLLDDASRNSRRGLPELNALIQALARNCHGIESLGIEKLIQPLIILLADALVDKDHDCIVSLLESLNSLIHTGVGKVVQTAKTSAAIWPILKILSIGEDRRTLEATCSIIRSMSISKLCILKGTNSLTSVTVDDLRPDQSDRDYWKKFLIKWVIEGEDTLSRSAAKALPEFTTEEEMVLMAEQWLSRVLISLSVHTDLLPSDGVENLEPSVIPSYIRYVADEILGISSRDDPPEFVDTLHRGSRVEPLALDWEEDHSEDTPLSKGISILCDLASENRRLCQWLMQAGILIPCRILSDKKTRSSKEQQEISRLVALLSRTESGNFLDWLPWLKSRADSDDIQLASNAMRSLIHINRRNTDPSFPDGIHFFDPSYSASYNLLASDSIQGSEIDVVFFHGIRGGPFTTWRLEETSDSHATRDTCWPSKWIVSDLGGTRLFSVSFAAPVSSWEGGSKPLKQTARKILEKLQESGIGDRPVVFVAHSMGGLVVKELLVQAMDKDRESLIAKNTKGIVFISTPHHGVWLAHVAWGLRYVGACPAPSLSAMMPGTYLEELNSKIAKWIEASRVPVLNFAETKLSKVSSLIPRLVVVVKESACPGYGECLELPEKDHVNSCKPKNREEFFYRKTLEFLKGVESCTRQH